MKRSGPSAADVAQLAGVSASAVSRALRPDGSASPAVRAKVRTAAAKLGYHPNAMARAMITQRSGVIAVIMSADTAIYYPEVLKELTLAISRRDARTMVFMLERPDDAEAAIGQALSYQVDGVIALTALDRGHVATLCDRRVPIILYNRVDRETALGTVSCDHFDSGRRLAVHLLGLGHRVFGLIEGPIASSVAVERMAGICAAFDSEGVSASVIRASGDYTYASGRAAMQTLAATADSITATIAANDMMALGAMDYARSVLCLEVPTAMSFAGFDGIGAAGWEGYGLATMRQPVRRMTEAATAILIEQIEQPDLAVEQRLFATQLIEGVTLAAAPLKPYRIIAA